MKIYMANFYSKILGKFFFSDFSFFELTNYLIIKLVYLFLFFSQAENLSKLNSLIRITENRCGNEYKPLKIGAYGVEKEEFARLFQKENFEQLVKVEKAETPK